MTLVGHHTHLPVSGSRQLARSLIFSCLPWLTLMVVVFSFQAGNLGPGSRDDMAGLRASYYIATYNNSTQIKRLRSHLQKHRHKLKARIYGHIKAWFSNAKVYALPHWVMGLFERLPLLSGFQSAFMSLTIICMLSGLSFFWLLRLLFAEQADLWRTFLLASLAPFILVMSDFFPFQSDGYLWAVGVPRGPSLLMALGALLSVWGLTKDPTSHWLARGAAAIAMACASFLIHRASGLLFLSVLALLYLWHCMKPVSPLTLAQRLGRRRFLLLLTLLIIALAVGKWLYIWLFIKGELRLLYPHSQTGWAAGLRYLAVLTAWSTGSVGLGYLWLVWRNRQPPAADLNRAAGDLLFNMLIPLAVLVISLNAVHVAPGPSQMFLGKSVEIILRLQGLAQLLWWLLSGLGVYFALGESQLRRLKAWALILLGSICIVRGGSGLHNLDTSWSEIFNRSYLSARVSGLLSQPPKQTYTKRTLYFHALANQMRERVLRKQP